MIAFYLLDWVLLQTYLILLSIELEISALYNLPLEILNIMIKMQSPHSQQSQFPLDRDVIAHRT